MSENTATKLSWDRNLQPTIGISSCLIGENVCHDGGNLSNDIICFEIAPWVNLQPFCPEVSAGMGVPRPEIKLVKEADHIYALGIDNEPLNATSRLSAAAKQAIHQWGRLLSGYIVKARSPSCGSGSTPLYNQQAATVGLTDGIFVRELKLAYPDLMIVDESFFANKDTALAFLNNCYYRHQLINKDMAPV